MMKRALRWIVLGTWLIVAGFAAAQDGARWTGDLDAGADKTRRPIVFVHGTLGSGSFYERAALRFASNGYPVTWISAYDYSTVPYSGDFDRLEAFIDSVRARTGFDKVDLVAHSRGTSVGLAYLSDPTRAAKVAHYAHVGAEPTGSVGGVPTIVLGSRKDAFFGVGAAHEGAVHAAFDDLDHVGLLTGSEGFAAVYAFFNDGQQPKTTVVTPQEPIAVGGRVLFSGSNVPVAGATVDVFEVVAQTGRRVGEKPYATFTVAADGAWGPFRAKAGQHYEFCVNTPDGGKLHYYREPFVRTDLLVYLVLRDPKSSSGQRMATALSIDDASSVLVVSPLDGAVVAGRDSLKINGVEIVTQETAPWSLTKVTFYFFDANHNKQSDLSRPDDQMFSSYFLSGADVYLPTEPPGSVKIEFNGRTLNVPNWKAKSEGAAVVHFN